MNNENMTSTYKIKVDAGFAAKQVVGDVEKHRKASKLRDCITYLKTNKMTEMMLEEYSMKFATIRGLNALDPNIMAKSSRDDNRENGNISCRS